MRLLTATELNDYSGVPVSANTPERTIRAWTTPVWLNYIRLYLGDALYTAIETELALPTPTPRSLALWSYLAPLVAAISVKNVCLNGGVGVEMLGVNNTVSQIVENAGENKRNAAANMAAQNESSAYASLIRFLQNSTDYPEYAPATDAPRKNGIIRNRHLTPNW